MKSKVPHFIRLRSGKPFAFAGLWEHWPLADGSEVRSATIITTEPNELRMSLHNRMPVILPPSP
jgi:putative SOS response-associated peptidase YedK